MSSEIDNPAAFPTVVIDNGSGSTKIGLAGDEEPSSVFPSLVGRYKVGLELDSLGDEGNEVYVGDEAIEKREILSLKYPVEHGVIVSFDDIEKIWYHSFYNELQIKPEEYRVLLSEIPNNPKQNRVKSTQIMFETFNVSALYLAVQEVLSLFASGRLNGIVIESGDGISHTVPIYEGYCIRSAVNRLNISGRDITNYLLKMLTQQEMYSFKMSDLIQIKETCGYVALDYDSELKEAEKCSDIETQYELPDGNVITIGIDRFRCVELLFKPELCGHSDAGIHRLAYNSIMSCDKSIRDVMYENIVLSGNSMLFAGMDIRLQNEMRALAPSMTDVNVIYSFPYKEGRTQMLVDGFVRSRFDKKLYTDVSTLVTDYIDNISFSIPTKNVAWIGGSVLGSLEDFNEYFISKDEYDSDGPYVVQRKCF